ncbi:MAG: cysteine--tRNA ligase [Chitinivibrionales bacterium]|nr:cysteine--tRNA ligase [Chitinivibrionales bacterium]
MSIRVYNTLSRSMEEFSTIEPNRVRMYACGITVYDEAHIGHASQAVFFDIIRNYLEYRGFRVDYIRNFTDIDDRIIAKANKTNKTAAEISTYFIQETKRDLESVKVKAATLEPKVTDHITEIIAVISGLIDKGAAYESNGDVLFAVETFKDYGKLSHQRPSELLEIEPGGGKRNPADFALWKASKPGEPAWQSPWGFGRPGWHIECSAMARKYLGDTLDIHGGGIDLVFPHHENEIAQSESLTGKPLARYWIHNGLVMVNNQKMSKSLGNFYTIKEAVRKYVPDVIRFIILSHHYSSRIDFSEDAFKNAEKRVFYFYKTLLLVNRFASQAKDSKQQKGAAGNGHNDLLAQFENAMDDNFNTAKVIAELSVACSTINKSIADKKMSAEQKTASAVQFIAHVKTMSGVLGFLDEEPESVIQRIKQQYVNRIGYSTEAIEQEIAQRSEAKKQKDFSRADAIRTGLLQKGIKLLDTAGATEWEIVMD